MAESAAKFIKKETLLPFLIAVGIIVNLIQFPLIRESAPRKWVAVRVNKTPDILQATLNDDIVLNKTHNTFIILGQSAPGSYLITNDYRHITFEVRSDLYGLGLVKKIKNENFNPVPIEKYIVKNKLKPQRTGERWASTGASRSGKPGTKWELYLDNNPKEIFFIQEKEVSKWLFVDKALLDDSTLKEVWR